MRKKILVVAVAGALAAPAVVFAQAQDRATTHPTERGSIPAVPAGPPSSVTISGNALLSISNQNVGSAIAARTKTSEDRMQDESSSIVFSVRENLGNGLAAVARFDLKPNMATGGVGLTGESWVGLASNSWGSLTAGRHALHYFKTPDDSYFRGASLRVSPSSLIEFAGGGRVAIANATRTPNTIKWTTPSWNGMQAVVAYSTSPLGTSSPAADMTAGNTARNGRAWNVNPTYTAANWAAGYSFWDSQADAPSAANGAAFAGLGSSVGIAAAALPAAAQLWSADQRGDTLYGHYMWGGWKLGLLWNKTKLTAAATAAGLASTGTELSNRTAWSIPLRYETGPHSFMASYTKAQDDSATAAQDGAKMTALTYAYSFSKRTHIALSWADLKNDAGAAYSPYVGPAGSTNGGLAAGESARTVSLGMRHNF